MKITSIIIIALSVIFSTQAFANLEDGCPFGTLMDSCGNCVDPLKIPVFRDCTSSKDARIIRRLHEQIKYLRERLRKAEQMLEVNGLTIDDPMVQFIGHGKSSWVKPNSMLQNRTYHWDIRYPKNTNDTIHVTVSPDGTNSTAAVKCPDGTTFRAWQNNTSSGYSCE